MGVLTSSSWAWVGRFGGGDLKTRERGAAEEGEDAAAAAAAVGLVLLFVDVVVERGSRGVLCTPVVLEGESIIEVSSSSS